MVRRTNKCDERNQRRTATNGIRVTTFDERKLYSRQVRGKRRSERKENKWEERECVRGWERRQRERVSGKRRQGERVRGWEAPKWQEDVEGRKKNPKSPAFYIFYWYCCGFVKNRNNILKYYLLILF